MSVGTSSDRKAKAAAPWSPTFSLRRSHSNTSPVPKVRGSSRRSKRSVHASSRPASGPATSGMGTLVSDGPSAGVVNEASRFRIAPMAWRATTRRVVKDAPLRRRSTS